MPHRAAAITASTITTLLVGAMVAPDVSAQTPSWLKVRTSTKVTAYNKGRAVVAPRAAAAGTRVITSLRVTAYRGAKRVAAGKTVRLKPGRYRTMTSGTYRAYRLVNRVRTRQVLHYGDYITATCRVTSVVDEGSGYTSSRATCSNPYWPRQRPIDDEFDTYQVGSTYRTYVPFNNEYVAQRYNTKVRSYGATHGFASAKRSLTVRNGGYRKVFAGSGNRDTRNFRSPGSNWRISYSFSCGEWTNFIVWLHRADGELIDLVANELDTSGGGSSREQGSGKFYLEIETSSDCSWRVSVK